MKVFKIIPKTKKLVASVFVMVLMAVGIFAFMMGNMKAIPMPVISQFLGVIFIITAIYILATKILKEMIYQVSPTDRVVTQEEIELCGPRARYDFIVAQHKGFRDIVMCRVGLDEVKEAVEINRLNRAKYREIDKKKKKYSYDTQFAPARQLRVVINDDTVVFLTYDEELLKILNKTMK
ncbi:MAG: hypothetical protein E7667_04105 [Ruminococcaceae bacterium]|nr:hypothetical protein [Oscillospiraceae bacterium]